MPTMVVVHMAALLENGRGLVLPVHDTEVAHKKRGKDAKIGSAAAVLRTFERSF